MLLKGWRYGAFVGSLIGTIGLFCYPSMIHPMLDPEPYKKARERAFCSDKSI